MNLALGWLLACGAREAPPEPEAAPAPEPAPAPTRPPDFDAVREALADFPRAWVEVRDVGKPSAPHRVERTCEGPGTTVTLDLDEGPTRLQISGDQPWDIVRVTRLPQVIRVTLAPKAGATFAWVDETVQRGSWTFRGKTIQVAPAEHAATLPGWSDEDCD